MFEFDADILSVIQRTENVKSFRVKVSQDVKFSPGQYLTVTVDTPAGKITKPLSFSSSPTETGYVEFTKRLTESAFSGVLDGMKAGGKVRLRMPFGKFTFDGEYPKIVLLAGGIGITPFRSICKNATDRKLPSDMILLYGNKTVKDIVFKEELDAMSRINCNLKVIYALTHSSCPSLVLERSEKRQGAGSNGHRPMSLDRGPGEVDPCAGLGVKGRFINGYIDGSVIKEKVEDYFERIFYVCGPPEMVKGLTETLKLKLNIPESNIRVEQFLGY